MAKKALKKSTKPNGKVIAAAPAKRVAAATPAAKKGARPIAVAVTAKAKVKKGQGDRGDVQRSRFIHEPALSLVPLAREPPNGCWPTTAPVGLSLT